MVFVFHGPVSAHDGGQLAQAFVPFLKAGDEDPGLAFKLFTAGFIPLAGHGEDLARSGKAADLFVKGHDAEQAAFTASVPFFPSTGPVWLGAFEPGEFGKGELVKGGLVVFEPEEVVRSQDQQDDCRFFWQWRASAVTTAPLSWEAASLARRCWATGSSQSAFLPL